MQFVFRIASIWLGIRLFLDINKSVDRQVLFSISMRFALSITSLFIFAISTTLLNWARGVTRLDGARGKKQVWSPHIRTN